MAGDRRWDRYLQLVERYIRRGKLESEELKYKRAHEQFLRSVTDDDLSSNWIKDTKGKDLENLNNLSRWSAVDAFAKWYGANLRHGAEALRDLWGLGDGVPDTSPSTDQVIPRIRTFSKRIPVGDHFGGRGTRMRLFAALLMRISAEHYPPFMVTLFEKSYKHTGHSPPPKDADEATLYEHSLRYLDRLVDEAAKRRLDLPRNRLEAQSVVWVIETMYGLADELLLDVSELFRIEKLLDDKRQIIFQGPPGTGKTFVARRLAEFLAGAAERVRVVQFHPSYAYEDFVQGFRPAALKDGQPGFELRNGPLLDAANAARAKPDEKHFLIIDEINRGNISKVFGELYYLLEYRDQDMSLQYSRPSERFSLPQNLYIIGTMNTADRSIALVDLALRRRFYFVEFHPDKPPMQELLGRWLRKNAPKCGWVAAVVDRANERLDDRQAAIGPSYFMKKGLDDDMVDRIWEHSVLPYIEEHLYGKQDRLAEFGLEALRKQAAADGEAEGEDEAPANETS